MAQQDRIPGGRILWLHQNFVTQSDPGNSRPASQVAALLDAGWNLHVIAPQGGYLGRSDGASGAESFRPGLIVERLALSEEYSPFVDRHRTYVEFCWRALWRGLKSRHVDRVYSSTPPLPQTLPAILLAAWFNVPLVLEVRDLWPLYAIECGRLHSRPLVFLMEWLEAFAYQFAERILVTSPAYVDYLQGMGIPTRSIRCVPTGGHPIDDPDADVLRRSWRLRHDVRDNDVVLLYAGSFNETYDLQLFLDAAALLEKQVPRLVWVFAGNGRQVETVRSAASRHACIRYVGNQSRGELPELYAAADIGLVTHARVDILRTALSSKVFDYLAAGLPVLATNRGITAALVEESGGGRATRNGRVEDVVETVQAMLQLGEKARLEMGRCGKEWVRRNASAAVMGNCVASVVQEAATRSSRGRTTWRLLRSCSIGFRHALTRRATRSAAPFLDWPDSSARRCLQDWMHNPVPPGRVSENRDAGASLPVTKPSPPGLFTIDVEDWYHPLLPDPRSWRLQEDRLPRPMQQLLQLLRSSGNRATFFVLGDVATRFPELVQDIVADGHEVGCHGHQHLSLDRLDPRTFRDDLRRGRDALLRAGAPEVVSFRAPCFSLDERRLWALDVLAEEGFRIDSSMFPMRTGRYGMRRCPNQPHWRGSILEIPISLPDFAGFRLPLSGGFYSRLFPHWLTHWGVRRMLASGQRPVHYVHPWELDPSQPRLAVQRFLSFRHYLKLDSTRTLLPELLERYRWQPLRDLLPATPTRDKEWASR